MRRAVKSRVDHLANEYGWTLSYKGRDIYQKDGYEVYMFSRNNGFELTRRNPETSERETILEVRNSDVCTSSPEYIALLKYVLENAENIVANNT